MMYLFIFCFIPFVLFIWGLILSRIESNDKEKKTGKVLVVISIIYTIIGIGYCGMLL